jgi:hypothetical protein
MPNHERQEDALDRQLRREFQAVADDGFSMRVMRALPLRQQTPAWVLPTAALGGGLLALVALVPAALWKVVLAEALAQDLGAASVTLLTLLLAFGFLSCAWALDESP